MFVVCEYVCVFFCVCMCICMHVSIYVFACVCMHGWCLLLCVCVFVMCVYVCMCCVWVCCVCGLCYCMHSSSSWMITTTCSSSHSSCKNSNQINCCQRKCMSHFQLILGTIHCLPHLKLSSNLLSVRRCPWLPEPGWYQQIFYSFNNKVDADSRGVKMQAHVFSQKLY